jgi:hypothetical protein
MKGTWVISEEVTCNEAGLYAPVFGRKIMEEKKLQSLSWRYIIVSNKNLLFREYANRFNCFHQRTTGRWQSCRAPQVQPSCLHDDLYQKVAIDHTLRLITISTTG